MRRFLYRLIGGCPWRHQWKDEDLGDDRTRVICVKCGKSHVVVRKPGKSWRVE